MRVTEWFDDAFDRVLNFGTDRYLARERKRLMAKYRFAVAPYWNEFGEHIVKRDRVRKLAAEGRIEEFEAIFAAAVASDATLPNAERLDRALLNRLYPPAPESRKEDEAFLAPFRTAFEKRRSPFFAGLYAMALSDVAYAARGSDWADAVKQEDWETHGRCLGLARQVLDAAPDHAGACLPWLMADYDLALEEPIEFEEYAACFERVWALDRYDLRLCSAHGIHLLPRWSGRDAHDLETFARRAVSLTEDRYGAGAYAMIHAEQALIGSHEKVDTLVDPDLLRQGFEDMAARFDGPSILNRYAVTMGWIGDEATVYRLFNSRIRTIVPSVWNGDDDDDQLEDALETFIGAREERADRLAKRKRAE